VAILFAVREGVRRTLVRELDEVLSEDLREIELFLQSPRYSWGALTEELNRKAVGHDFHRWFVQFYDAEGQPGWASVHTPELPAFSEQQRAQRALSVYDAGEASDEGASARPGRGQRGQSYRVSYRVLPRPIPEAAAVCVGCSQSYLSRDLATIDRQVLLVGLAVLVISPLVGHLLTNRTIQPLARMIRTTARMRPGELAQRVPVRGTGDELDSLARTINGLLDRIAEYLRKEHDFLANAAHDLRTPLAAIRSNVEVALSGARSPEEYRELLALIIEQCGELQTLVNQLLLLAETESDRLQMDAAPVALDDLVGRVVEMFQGVAEERRVALSVGKMEPAQVTGNRHHLWQVVSNLVDNAIKFAAARQAAGEGNGDGGVVNLQLVADRKKGSVKIAVQDNGIGIAASDLPHIFDRFYRADKSRARDAGARGSGLGLSICKAIVDAHRGSIHVRSDVGQGTTFTVVLPLG
jgi:heavy metal sensor kinase